MPGQPVVGVDEVRLHEVLRGQVISDEPREVGAGFFAHAVDEVIVEAILRVETDIRVVATDMAEVEPVIREGTDEPIEAGVGQQAVGLGA